jgi:copper chaperone CopZ
MLSAMSTVLFVALASSAQAQPSVAAALPYDTVTVRLHISGMTCGSCPLTARVAIQKLPGVYGATVTLDDSLGIVRYDPARVTPDQIAAHLAEMTGFTARVLPDPKATPRKPGE